MSYKRNDLGRDWGQPAMITELRTVVKIFADRQNSW